MECYSNKTLHLYGHQDIRRDAIWRNQHGVGFDQETPNVQDSRYPDRRFVAVSTFAADAPKADVKPVPAATAAVAPAAAATAPKKARKHHKHEKKAAAAAPAAAPAK